MNNKLALDWVKHFNKFSTARQHSIYRLLIFNNLGSYVTREFIQFCDDKKIIPFALLLHTLHFTQPLDVVIFQPFKH